MARTRQPCGTYAGYRRHMKYGQSVDEACQEARKAYDHARYLRMKEAGGWDDNTAKNSRRRAMRQLALEYPERFAVLLAEDAAERGKTPLVGIRTRRTDVRLRAELQRAAEATRNLRRQVAPLERVISQLEKTVADLTQADTAAEVT